MKRNLRHPAAVALIAALCSAFVGLPAAASSDEVPAALEAPAPDGDALVHEVVSFLGSWLHELTAPLEEALRPGGSAPNRGEGTGQESPGLQAQSGGAADPDG